MTVYADEAFLLNAAADYILLLTAARICDAPVKRLRLLLGAAMGGGFAILSLYAPFSHPAFVAVYGALMAVASFGGEKRIFRLTLVFFAVAALFGGFAYAASELFGGALSFKALALVFLPSWAVILLIFRRSGRAEGKISKLSVTFGGRSIELRALHDTGNSLSDPISGRRAAVIHSDEASRLFTGARRELILSIGEMGAEKVFEALSDKRFRLIPYSSLGVRSGLILAFLPDEVKIDGKNADILVAVSPCRIEDGGAYSALLGA